MAEPTLPDPPAQLKAIQSYMRVASDVERIDPVVAYWARLYSTESALKIDKNSPECKTFLVALISYLEKFKQSQKDNEAVNNQTVGQAHMENFVVALFTKADTLDREGNANKNVVRMFYMSAVLFEAMEVFGSLTEEISQKAKYAKFKAAYIQKCLKTGQTPVPGPLDQPTPDASQGEEAPSGQIPSSATGGPTATNSVGNDLQIPEVPTDEPGQDSLKKDPFILTPSTRAYPPQMPLHPQLPIIQPKTPVAPPASSNSSYNSQGTTTNTAATTTTTSRTGAVSTIMSTRFQATNGAPLNPEDLLKAQKYCKYTNSALQYDDIPTAVENLEKALKLLKTGERSD